MASYVLSNKAILDLSGIWEYTFDTWSEKHADKYYFMLLETCQDLADRKVSGKYYFEIEEELLGYRAGQHIIFYKQSNNNNIEVIRILHVQMDLKNRIQE